jgi:hypothetical protein
VRVSAGVGSLLWLLMADPGGACLPAGARPGWRVPPGWGPGRGPRPGAPPGAPGGDRNLPGHFSCPQSCDSLIPAGLGDTGGG